MMVCSPQPTRRCAPHFILVALVLLASACASPPHGDKPVLRDGKYRIDAGDTLEIRVLPEPVLARELLVRPDGRITMDLIGDVLVQARTTDHVAKEIRKKIARYRRDPVVSVAVRTAASQEVTVAGEVEEPKNYPAERGLRVTDAISRAGDVTELAAASRVRLIRSTGDNSTIYIANLDRIRAGDDSTNYLILSGDVIFVPPSRGVEWGYSLRRFLYPVEVALSMAGRIIFGGLL